MAARSTPLVVFSFALFVACAAEPVGSPEPRVEAFAFAGSDLIVFEHSTARDHSARFPRYYTNPDARVIRYPGGDLSKPHLIIDDLTLDYASNGALVVIGNRALLRHRFAIWLLDLDNRAREEVPFGVNPLPEDGTFVTDGNVVYTRAHERNTELEYGKSYVGVLDADAYLRPLKLTSPASFAVDSASIYLAKGCTGDRLDCPEAGVHRAGVDDADFTQVVRFDPATTKVALHSATVSGDIAVRGGVVYFATQGGGFGCTVHVAELGKDASARDLYALGSQCLLAATDDGVVICDADAVIAVNVMTGAHRKLAPASDCERIEWHDGLVAWLERPGYYGGRVRTARTR